MPLELSKRWFAWALCHVAERYDPLLADRKRDLLGKVAGTVVEIGPGTGVNFRYYPFGVRWIGIEPNLHMHPYLWPFAISHRKPGPAVRRCAA